MSTQNWGWLVISCEEKRPRYIDGEEIPNWQQGPTLFEVVNYLGGKGWLYFLILLPLYGMAMES